MYVRDKTERATNPHPALLATSLALVLAALLLPGCGGNGAPSEVESLIAKAQESGGDIRSYHMELSMSFEVAETDRVKTEELVMDVAGSDVSLTDTFYDPETGEGTVIQEVIRVGDKQYRKDLASGAWVEEQPTLSEDAAATYTSHISDFVSNSISAEKLGDEKVNGVDAAHLRFELSPENVLALLPDMPQPNLESSSGGQVDIWIDTAAYYPVRYEMAFRNVTIGRGYGNVDVMILIDITGIDQPLEITPPV